MFYKDFTTNTTSNKLLFFYFSKNRGCQINFRLYVISIIVQEYNSELNIYFDFICVSFFYLFFYLIF